MNNAAAARSGISTLNGLAFAQFVSGFKREVANCKSRDRARITGTNDMIEALSIDFPAARYDTVVHHLNGRAAGALVLEKGKGKVLAMVTHPDSKGVGSALMERAVNLTKQQTGRSELHLETMDDRSAAAYARMGFVMLQAADSGSESGLDSDSDSDITCEPMILHAGRATNWRTDSDGQMHLNNRSSPRFIA